LSANPGAGLDLLKQLMLERVGWQTEHGGGLFMARERHVEALRRAGQYLARASLREEGLELLAEELRLAHEALGAITGEYSAEALLGEIFSRFCIGK
jgi:tRNA modification GTPase